MNIISVAKDLIKIPSISGDTQEIQNVLDYVKNLFKNTTAVVEVIQKKGISPVICIYNRKTKNPDIAILGHLDVVPAEKKQFTPKQKDGRLYGRGALDMKSFAAVSFDTMLYAIERNLPLSLAIVLETDEETGSQGMQHFIQTHPDFIPKVVLDIDVGGDKTKIIDKCKSAIFVDLTAQGKSAHGSMPWDGIDANEKIMQAIAFLRKKYPHYAADGKRPKNKWTNTMCVSKISGGQASNIVSDFCEAMIDFRLTDVSEIDKLKSTLNLLKKRGINYEIPVIANPVIVDRNNPYLKRYKSITENTLKQKIKFQQIGGVTTSRLLAEKGSTIIYHAGSGSGMHGKDEYVDVDSLKELSVIQKQFLENF